MLPLLQPIIDKSVTRTYNSGSTILFQGEVPRSACIIQKGIVRVYTISSQGEEQIIAYQMAGEFFPVSWIFSKTPGTLFFYETVGECELALVGRQELVDFIKSDKEKYDALIEYFATNYAASQIRVTALEQPKAREKLLYTLYYLCQRYGHKMHKKDFYEIELQLTHQNLASLVGLTRETTATEMNKFKREKILTYDHKKYIVNMERLMDLLGEDSFRGISIKI